MTGSTNKSLSLDPWKYAFLSIVWPGLGHIGLGDMFVGYGFVLGSVAVGVLFLATVTYVLLSPEISVTLFNLSLPVALLLLYMIISLIAIVSSYKRARAMTCPPFISPSHQMWKGFFFTYLAPGLGHIVVRRYIFGLLLVVLWFLTLELDENPQWFWIPVLVLFGAFWDLIRRSGTHLGKDLGMSLLIIVIMIIVLESLPVTSIVRRFFIEAFRIPSEAMSPTLISKDRIFVSKIAYKGHEIERGDVILFHLSDNPQRSYLKRVIGLSGETLMIEDGDVFVNGEKVDKGNYDFYYETREDWPYGKKGVTVEIPPESYFVLGDNSKLSSDSRLWGFVPKENITGKAYKIYYPFDRSEPIQ